MFRLAGDIPADVELVLHINGHVDQVPVRHLYTGNSPNWCGIP